MSAEEQGSNDNSNAEAANAGIANIERTFLRLTFWQTLLSLAGVFTGAVALYAALNESQAVRQQTAASVWPYVEMMIDDTDDGDSARFSLRFENVGVGPARMRSVFLTLDGESVATWQEMTDQLIEAPQQVGVNFGRSSISRRVIAPGQSIVAFRTSDPALARRMQDAVYGGRTGLRYCYCSIFDECWQTRILAAADGRVEPVEACPDFGESGFRD